ncbi:hypothetical protein QQ045_017739 [Rhodiola kirilowii]
MSIPPRVVPSTSNPSQPPVRTRSPMPAHDPRAPDFEPNNSIDTVDEADDEVIKVLEEIPSIRCKKSQSAASGDEGGEKKKKVCSLLVHEIGSVVKDKVPTLAPSFRKLEEKDLQIVYDHLYPNFVIHLDDDQLWNFIFKRATERYRDWKSDCKLFYKEHGPGVIPREFVDRRDQWEWLKSHFDDPNNKERGALMSKVRTESERIDHHSGKVPFYMRAAQLKLQGERAPIVATYSKVYSADLASVALATQMEERVRQALNDMDGDENGDGCVLDEKEPLPVDTQIQIITEVLGQNVGLMCREQKQKTEFVEMKAAFEERIRTLEELVVRQI